PAGILIQLFLKELLAPFPRLTERHYVLVVHRASATNQLHDGFLQVEKGLALKGSLSFEKLVPSCRLPSLTFPFAGASMLQPVGGGLYSVAEQESEHREPTDCGFGHHLRRSGVFRSCSQAQGCRLLAKS